MADDRRAKTNGKAGKKVVVGEDFFALPFSSRRDIHHPFIVIVIILIDIGKGKAWLVAMDFGENTFSFFFPGSCGLFSSRTAARIFLSVRQKRETKKKERENINASDDPH